MSQLDYKVLRQQALGSGSDAELALWTAHNIRALLDEGERMQRALNKIWQWSLDQGDDPLAAILDEAWPRVGTP